MAGGHVTPDQCLITCTVASGLTATQAAMFSNDQDTTNAAIYVDAGALAVATMTPGTYVGIDPAALDGSQALDGAWTLDGSVSGPGVMTYATTTGAAMTKASAAAATMTGA